MDLFFRFASPTTLASLIVDLEQADEWTDEENALHQRCAEALAANVGSDEAIALLKAAGAIGL